MYKLGSECIEKEMNTGQNVLELHNYLEKFLQISYNMKRAILSKIHTWYAQFQYELNIWGRGN